MGAKLSSILTYSPFSTPPSPTNALSVVSQPSPSVVSRPTSTAASLSSPSSATSSSPIQQPILEQHTSSVAFGKPFLIRWDDSTLAPVATKTLGPRRLSSKFVKGTASAMRRISSFVRKANEESDSTLPPSTDLLSVRNNSSSSSSADQLMSNVFWCADETSRECYGGEVCQTSLLTFHAQNADAVNVKGSGLPLTCVADGSIVTIYANVGGGRYLTLGEDVSCTPRFVSSPQQIRSDTYLAHRSEFLVRRVQADDGELAFGDAITLESCALSGLYLCLASYASYTNRRLSLTFNPNQDSARFVLHSPTLRELVQLNASSSASSFLSATTSPTVHSNDFEREESRREAEKEREFMKAIARNLPVELAKKIFEFHRDWIRTARLTCKSWKLQAERSIKRVRVNGEFCSLDTEEERRDLIAFVHRCPSLEVLTLRNVMTLTDDDISKITENKNLTSLVLGGCRRLSDRSTLAIADNLGCLRHLNMAFTNITDESLRIVASRFLRLKELNLYHCTRVTVDGINRSADIESGLNALEHFNLRGTVVDAHLVQDFKRKKPQVVVLTGPASADSIWG